MTVIEVLEPCTWAVLVVGLTTTLARGASRRSTVQEHPAGRVLAPAVLLTGPVLAMVCTLTGVGSVPPVPTAPPSASPEAPRHVTRHEYARVSQGMTRTRVERIFGAGRGCVHVTYELDDVLHTGRQYRNTAGTTVSVQYEKPDGGRNHATGKQWGLLESCFDARARTAPHRGGVVP